MQFMVVLRRRTETYSAEEFAPRLDEEAERARALYAQGVIRQIWSRSIVGFSVTTSNSCCIACVS